ncbi:MAG: HAD family hydrolase [Betaproteobacteria bacterium]
MIRAVLFDMGGTLDGDGRHWLDRFVALYAAAGVARSREELRAAFDAAERRAAIDASIASANLHAMVERHVEWQFASLGLDDADLRRRIVDGFVAPVRAAAPLNARLLADLAACGLRLGVVSNGCGNVSVLCDELGFAPSLSTVVDSRRVGLFKPDPAIFSYAVSQLGVPPPEALMVGDSFDRDVRPAKTAGLQTAWLEGPGTRVCPDPSLVDFRLASLDALRSHLPAAERIVAS